MFTLADVEFQKVKYWYFEFDEKKGKEKKIKKGRKNKEFDFVVEVLKGVPQMITEFTCPPTPPSIFFLSFNKLCNE